jgi:hypothetical protein
VRVFKTLQFDRNDIQDNLDLSQIEEFCSQSASFFHENREGAGLRSIRYLVGRQSVEMGDIQEAIDDVNAAVFRLKNTQPDQFLSVATKNKQTRNLEQVLVILCRWRRALE